MDELTFSFAVSALVVAFIMFSGAAGGLPPLFAIALLALAMAGHFALAAFRKAGVAPPNSEYLFIGAAFGAYLVAAVSAGAFSAILPLAFIPLIFCAPAVGALVRGAISSG